MVFTIQCAGTHRLLPFFTVIAPPWLFWLQILSRKADIWTSSFSMLLRVSPSLTSRQNSLTGGWRITPGHWPRGLSMASFQESAQEANSSMGWRTLSACTAGVISSLCKWRQLVCFPICQPQGEPFGAHTHCRLGDQFHHCSSKLWDFRPSSPSLVESTRCPVGNCFGELPTSGTAWVLCVCWPASTYLPLRAGLSLDSNLPYSPRV